MLTMIIQTKTPMNPIYSFLCHSWKQTKAEKLEILKTIDEFYNLSKVIHTDLYQIRKDGRFLWGEYVRPNLTILFDFCGSKGKKYLLKVFGKSYSITSPLSWRFERRKHFTWVALEMVNRNFKNGKCSIEHQGNQFQITSTNQADIITDQSDPTFFQFLKSKINIDEKVEINMDNLLGIGGESLVMKFQEQSGVIAIKIIPLDGEDTSTKLAVKNDLKQFQITENPNLRLKIRTSTENAINKFRSITGRKPNLAGDLEIFKMERQSGNVRNEQAEFECSSIQHPNVMRYGNVTLDIVNDQVALIAEMEIHDCSLWDLLKNFAVLNSGPTPRPILISTRFKMFESIFAGVKYIQDRGFKHLDLKPSNILIKTRPDGSWNKVDCRITDFGIGGKEDRQTGQAGTPGFTSPEQLIGNGIQKSDNYSLGKLMVMIFTEWNTAWNLLFQPISERERNNLNFGQERDALFGVIRGLLTTDPNDRWELQDVGKMMEVAKDEICSLPPFSMVVTTNYANISEKTQNSVFVQKEIEQFTTECKTDKNLPNPASTVVTSRVHDQRQTNLCASFAGTSTLRGAAKRFLRSKGNSLQQISDDLEGLQGNFTFNKMLTLLTGCVSPRSLDGLAVNSLNENKYLHAQFQTIQNVNDRLVCKTALETEGWRRILPISELFKKYNLNPDQIELESIKVYHPLVGGNDMTFSDALSQNIAVYTMVFSNTMTPGGYHSPHAVTIYKEEQNTFIIKNSYFAQKEIRIDSRIPVYHELQRNHFRFCRTVRQIDPNFSDDDFILFHIGFAFRFKDKNT